MEPIDEVELFRLGRERRKHYRILKTLGEGADGKVRLVECLESEPREGTHRRRRAALKTVRKTNLGTPVGDMKVVASRRMVAVFAAASTCNHHLPQYVDFFEDAKRFFIVWELLACPLTAYVAHQPGGKLCEADAAKVLVGALSGLSTLHSVGIVHRDIKTANLMLRNVSDLSSVCVCDMAHAVVTSVFMDMFRSVSSNSLGSNNNNTPPNPISSPSPSTAASIMTSNGSFASSSDTASSIGQTTTGGNTETSSQSHLSLVAGTPAYMSPGASVGYPPSPKDDIWGLGCTAHELLYGRLPFYSAESFGDLFRRIVEGDRDEIPPEALDAVSIQGRSFVEKLLRMEEATRPSAEEALWDPWILQAASQDKLHSERLPVGAPLDWAKYGSAAVAKAKLGLGGVGKGHGAADDDQADDDNLLPPLASFSKTFTGNSGHAFAVTGANVMFDPVTGELKVAIGEERETAKSVAHIPRATTTVRDWEQLMARGQSMDINASDDEDGE